MVDVREAFPRCQMQGWGRVTGRPSYDEIIESFGAEIVVDVTDDNYQGYSRYMLRDGDRFGFLIVGWGSCSGCDALQACDTHEELQELVDQLERDIHWEDSAADMLTYVNSKDWETERGGYKREQTERFIDAAREALQS
jgi:hypothetical protein